ncbi:MAG: DEAD/DEAH box helicase [Gemmatimonadales bacterium]|jgi:ATP-dependent Lhr-like helicase
MSSQASDSESSSFSLLDERIRRWIWQARWTELRDAQERAIPAILEGKRDVIIAAATATGKTEAAFFPILTRLLAVSTPACTLYISPLKALISDQWLRLEPLCESLDVPVVPWHGDISVSRKREFLKDPRGCLLITPESLEGLLMREGHALVPLLGGLRYIVVDELHAFIDTERGKQLQSLMHRIDVALGRSVPRIGLSATLGEIRLAAEFLRPGAGALVEIVDSGQGGQELKVVVKGVNNLSPRPAEMGSATSKDDGAADGERDEAVGAGAMFVGEQLFATLRGSNNLVFPNSRKKVELYADLLRRASDRLGVPNEFWPHHGSLSKEIREETESALKDGGRPTTAIATTTLELGIDIGAVKSIAQVGPAPSVASLRQRLGRSGRRPGEAAILRCYCIENPLEADTPISDQLREGLVQTIAQIRLLVGGWCEPPRVQSMHLSTLVQQLLSLIAQYGGLSAAQAWSLLCSSELFPGITKSEFAELLGALGDKQVVMQDATGLLLHGVLGERIVNHYSFLAAFSSPDEFRVTCGGKPLGTLPLERPLAPESYLIFAGRRWRVVGCYPEDRLIDVVPARGGKLPLFDGLMGGKVHDRVRQEMRAVLAEPAVIPFLDASAMAQLSEARSSYQHLGLYRDAAIQRGTEVRLFTWQGDWVNDTLALMLTARKLRAANEGLSIMVLDAGVESVLDALFSIGHEPTPSGESLAAEVANKLKEKWDGLLPDSLLCKNYASSELEVPGAVAAARAVWTSCAAQQRERSQ